MLDELPDDTVVIEPPPANPTDASGAQVVIEQPAPTGEAA